MYTSTIREYTPHQIGTSDLKYHLAGLPGSFLYVTHAKSGNIISNRPLISHYNLQTKEIIPSPISIDDNYTIYDINGLASDSISFTGAYTCHKYFELFSARDLSLRCTVQFNAKTKSPSISGQHACLTAGLKLAMVSFDPETWKATDVRHTDVSCETCCAIDGDSVYLWSQGKLMQMDRQSRKLTRMSAPSPVSNGIFAETNSPVGVSIQTCPNRDILAFTVSDGSLELYDKRFLKQAMRKLLLAYPFHSAISSSANEVYVTEFSQSEISVISTLDFNCLHTIHLPRMPAIGRYPEPQKLWPNENQRYKLPAVANSEALKVTSLSTADNKLLVATKHGVLEIDPAEYRPGKYTLKNKSI